MLRRVIAPRSLLLRRTPQASSVRTFAAKSSDAETLRPIHFEQEESDAAARPFAIVGVRDVEVLDWEYPTRIEGEQKANRTVRNRFNHPNFISLWVDKLAAVESYLAAEQIPYTSEGIVKGPDGHDVLVIEPSVDGSSVAFFNLCDAPTLVELVQATDAVLKDFHDDDDDAADE